MTDNNRIKVTYGDEEEKNDNNIQAIRDELESKLKTLKALLQKYEPEFDEPVESLSPLSREEILKLLKELSSSGKSMVVITHELEEIQAKLKELETSK